MPTELITYEIDDSKSVDDNLHQLIQTFIGLDEALGPVLAPVLSAMSHGSELHIGELSDALYAATAPEDEVGTGGSEDTVSGSPESES